MFWSFCFKFEPIPQKSALNRRGIDQLLFFDQHIFEIVEPIHLENK